MNFVNSLNWIGWLALAAVPPAIVALYFLKLKRQPVEVPSTFLWSRAIEDLHVNSIWQRLRRNLLLFLQLLLLALIIFACLRPGWRGTELSGNRFIFLIDTSASMTATDVEDGPTRLDAAKSRVAELIDGMKDGDQAMIISFSDRYRTVQAYTSNQSELRRELEEIEPTTHQTDIGVALRAAAGLANPGRSSEAGTMDVQVAEAVPATLFIVSDGRFADVPDFSLGNLSPKFLSVGDANNAANVGIVAFSVDQNPEKPDRVQAFARIENYGGATAELLVALYLNDEWQDVETVRVPSRNDDGAGSASVSFYLTGDRVGDLDGDVLTIELKDKRRFDSANSTEDDRALGAAVFADHLPLDNIAHAVINAPRQARVLLVTPDNAYLRMGLGTGQLGRLANVTEKAPAFLKSNEYIAAAAGGDFDLIIYDQCVPEQMPVAKRLVEDDEEGAAEQVEPEYMPQANTLFVGTLPPSDWSGGETQQLPGIIDIDHAHPLMHLMMDLRNVIIFEGFSVQGPPGSKSLVDSNVGSLLTISPREGFEDAVLGFPIISTDENGQSQFNTNWPRRVSFPVFLRNVVTHLGGSRGLFATPNVNPGSPATLRSVTPVEEIRVRPPKGDDVKLSRGRQNAFLFGSTERPGVYEIREGSSENVIQRFAVNLFDTQESNIMPREFTIGHQQVAAEAVWHTARQELWKWLLLAGMVVLVVEWYIFNRCVYV